MNGIFVDRAISGVCVVAFIGAVSFLVGHCVTGCAEPVATQVQRAKNAADVVGYTDALAECRKEGADAGSWWVYDRCAKEADIRYGYDGGAP